MQSGTKRDEEGLRIGMRIENIDFSILPWLRKVGRRGAGREEGLVGGSGDLKAP